MTDFQKEREKLMFRKLNDLKTKHINKYSSSTGSDFIPKKNNETLKMVEDKINTVLRENSNSLYVTGDHFSDIYFKRIGTHLIPSKFGCSNTLELLKIIPSIDIKTDTKGIKITTKKNLEKLQDQPVVKKITKPIKLKNSECGKLKHLLKNPLHKDNNSSEKKIMKKDQEKQLEQIPENIVKIFQSITESYGGAFPIDRIQVEYENRADKELDLKKLGCSSILEFVQKLNPKEFSVWTNESHAPLLVKTSQFKPDLIKKSKEEINSSEDADINYSLGIKVCQRLSHLLVEEFPNGLDLEELIPAYRGFYGATLDDLNCEKYGHNSLQSLLSKETGTVKLISSEDKVMVVSRGYSINDNYKSFIFHDNTKDLACVNIALQTPTQIVKSTASFRTLDTSTLYAIKSAVEVVIAEVYNPSKFWVIHRSKEHSHMMDEMMDRMFEFYNSPLSKRYAIPTEKISIFSPVSALYEPDKNFYRAVITSREDLKTVKLFFVDYGTVCKAPISSLRYLHETFFELPAQAVQAALYGITPADGKRIWSRAVTLYFLKEVQDESVAAYINDIIGDKIFVTIKKDCDDVDLAQKLVQEGKAVSKKGVFFPASDSNENTKKDLEKKLQDLVDDPSPTSVIENQNPQYDPSFSEEINSSSGAVAITPSQCSDSENTCSESISLVNYKPNSNYSVPILYPTSLYDTLQTCKAKFAHSSSKKDENSTSNGTCDNSPIASPISKLTVKSNSSKNPWSDSGNHEELFFSDEEEFAEKDIKKPVICPTFEDTSSDVSTLLPAEENSVSENRNESIVSVKVLNDLFLTLVSYEGQFYLPLPEMKIVTGKNISVDDLGKVFGSKFDDKNLVYLNYVANFTLFMELARYTKVSYLFDESKEAVKHLPLISVSILLHTASKTATHDYYENTSKNVINDLIKAQERILKDGSCPPTPTNNETPEFYKQISSFSESSSVIEPSNSLKSKFDVACFDNLSATSNSEKLDDPFRSDTPGSNTDDTTDKFSEGDKYELFSPMGITIQRTESGQHLPGPVIQCAKFFESLSIKSNFGVTGTSVSSPTDTNSIEINEMQPQIQKMQPIINKIKVPIEYKQPQRSPSSCSQPSKNKVSIEYKQPTTKNSHNNEVMEIKPLASIEFTQSTIQKLQTSPTCIQKSTEISIDVKKPETENSEIPINNEPPQTQKPYRPTKYQFSPIQKPETTQTKQDCNLVNEKTDFSEMDYCFKPISSPPSPSNNKKVHTSIAEYFTFPEFENHNSKKKNTTPVTSSETSKPDLKKLPKLSIDDKTKNAVQSLREIVKKIDITQPVNPPKNVLKLCNQALRNCTPPPIASPGNLTPTQCTTPTLINTVPTSLGMKQQQPQRFTTATQLPTYPTIPSHTYSTNCNHFMGGEPSPAHYYQPPMTPSYATAPPPPPGYFPMPVNYQYVLYHQSPLDYQQQQPYYFADHTVMAQNAYRGSPVLMKQPKQKQHYFSSPNLANK